MKKAKTDKTSQFNSTISKYFKKLTPIDNNRLSSEENQRKRKSEEDDDFTDKTTITNGLSQNSSITETKKLKFTSQDSIELLKENMENLEPFDGFSDDFTQHFQDLIETMDSDLNLKDPQYCTIMSYTTGNQRAVLDLQTVTTNKRLRCSIEGFWLNNRVQTGGKVYVSATKKSSTDWIIDNETGWIVYEPDLLISCTSVVGSIFCKRRSVLAEKYRGFEPANRAMVIGVFVHNLLRSALKNKLHTLKQVEAIAEKLMKSANIIHRLYECDLSFNDFQTEINLYIPKIVEFIKQYVIDGYCNDKTNWQGQICDIDDIEENIWCHQLGIKGKIDVTISTKTQRMPLELKTGRATLSLEHRGQLILYVMMMIKLGYKVNSGLLLYIKDGILREIPTTEKEKRDLIIQRNDLAYYLSRNINDNCLELPDPIDNQRACNKCPYNIICTSYLQLDNRTTSNETIKKITTELTAHLTIDHLQYFSKWSSLICKENEYKSGRKNIQEIYTITPETRQKDGRCIANAKLVKILQDCNGVYEQIFEKNESTENLLTSNITENQYVIVSIDNRPAIAAGFVTQINSFQITLGLERDLSVKYKNCLFHIDTYDSFSIEFYNLTSLSLILEPTERANELRQLIIDRIPPKFLPKLPKLIAKKAVNILKRLNRVQQRAVLRALAAQQFLLIKGMPGTGKTATLVALIQLLNELDKTVLLTSHTHSAIDNVCIRLKESGLNFLRLGSDTRIHDNIKSYSEYNQTKHCKSPEELEDVYNSFTIVAVTCLGSGHTLLSKRTFDVCIVDESTQVLQVSVIKPLYSAKTFILVGDPEQLPPVVKNPETVNAGMTETLFDRLNTPEAVVTLNLNYRMNRTITSLANAVTYGGELKTADKTVEENCLTIRDMDALKLQCKDREWLLKVLDPSLEAAVQIVDTGPVWKTDRNKTDEILDSQNCINHHEAGIIKIIVETLIKIGVPEEDIGIIATFRAQVALLISDLRQYNVDVSTVDQYQGRDKNIIIYSCTKSKEISNSTDLTSEILNDRRRLTVAITRAKQKFILVGDLKTIENYSTFKILLKSINPDCFTPVQINDLNI